MISLNRIKEAHKKILPYINYTPLMSSDFLSQNRKVKLKSTGSFISSGNEKNSFISRPFL